MAEEVGLGRYHFLRVFRRVVHATPYAYWPNRRLAGTAAVLDDGSGVLDAAIASGFSDLSEFTSGLARSSGSLSRTPATGELLAGLEARRTAREAAPAARRSRSTSCA